jgi:hypothetical protein
LPSKEGNYIFSCLVNDKLISIEEKENCIIITTSSGVTLEVDTCMELPSDNFHMKHEDELPFMV